MHMAAHLVRPPGGGGPHAVWAAMARLLPVLRHLAPSADVAPAASEAETRVAGAVSWAVARHGPPPDWPHFPTRATRGDYPYARLSPVPVSYAASR